MTHYKFNPKVSMKFIISRINAALHPVQPYIALAQAVINDRDVKR